MHPEVSFSSMSGLGTVNGRTNQHTLYVRRSIIVESPCCQEKWFTTTAASDARDRSIGRIVACGRVILSKEVVVVVVVVQHRVCLGGWNEGRVPER